MIEPPAMLLPLDDSPAPHTEALGWQWAYGCFETFVWNDGGTIALGRHLERLQRGVEFYGLNPLTPCRELAGPIRKALAPFEEKRMRVRLEAVLDDSGLMTGSPPPFRSRLGLRVHETPPSDRPGDLSVRLLAPGSAEEFPPSPGFKPLAYADRLLQTNRVRQGGFAEGILCTRDLRIVSGFLSNLFVRNAQGVWLTPGLECGCLPGVTRGLLLEMNGGEEIREGDVQLHDLTEARNVVLVSSGRGVLPISRIEFNEDSTIRLDLQPAVALANRFAHFARSLEE